MTKKYLAAAILLVLPLLSLRAKDEVTDTLWTGRAVSNTPATMLSGSVAGVRVSSLDGSLNGMKSVNIRGLNTLRGDSQPIWIVDGAVISPAAHENSDLFFKSDFVSRAYTSSLNDMGWLGAYEVESIRVVKDMSEAARYGVSGANGVIIVKTRQAKEGDRNIHLNSNVGVDFRPKVGDAFRCGIFHNHDLGLNGKIGSNSFYKVAGFFRQDIGAVKGEKDRNLGLAIGFETRANSIFKFGLNSFLSYDKSANSYGTNYIGSTSAMIVSRYPNSFAVDTVDGWTSEYDDDNEWFRTVSSVYLEINFLPGLAFKIDGGVDFMNQNRIVWFGDKTAFGHEVAGAAGVQNNSLLNYNVKGELSYFRNFAVKHRLEVGGAADFEGYYNRTNAMCASTYNLPYLRGRGISTSTGGKRIRKFARPHSDLGGYIYAKYDYDGWAGIEGTFRVDKNFKYGAPALLYPAGSAFVDIHKICLTGSKAVSALKITGGYGIAGRETDLPYEYLPYWILNVPAIDRYADYYYDGVNTLRSKEWNVGATAGFLNDRFNLSFKYYDKTTEDRFAVYNDFKVSGDLFVEAPKWSLTEERTTVIRNSGIEFDTDLHIISTSVVDWALNANVAWNMNRIVEIDEKDVNAGGIVKGMYYAPQALDAGVSGNAVPKVFGGFGTSVSFYGVTVDLKFTGAAGHEIINANRILEKWGDTITEDCIEKGDFLRFDHIGAAYDVPLKAKWIKGLKVTAAGHNLATFTKYSGWNPDVNSYGVCVRNSGADYGSFPVARSFVIGINLKF